MTDAVEFLPRVTTGNVEVGVDALHVLLVVKVEVEKKVVFLLPFKLCSFCTVVDN